MRIVFPFVPEEAPDYHSAGQLVSGLAMTAVE